ncbi:MAG: hypothetical protein HXY45_04865 [Syntrophaceae bacterium]|nr:hypothetical protein [Syntrophaceae bacterium]
MKKTILVLVAVAVLSASFSLNADGADFQLYPGARLDAKATQESLEAARAAEITGSCSWGIAGPNIPYLLNQDVLFGFDADRRFPPGSDVHLKWGIKRMGSIR